LLKAQKDSRKFTYVLAKGNGTIMSSRPAEKPTLALQGNKSLFRPVKTAAASGAIAEAE